MEFLFRQGSIEDKEQLKELGLLSFGQYSKILDADNWQLMRTNLSNDAYIDKLLSISKIFICLHEKTIVGMIYLIPSGNAADVFESSWSYIRMLGIRPGYEGQGIARKLIEQCITESLQSGEKIIALHTSEFMDAARHLYENFGFKILKEINPRFGKKYWLYKLDLV